MEGKPLVSVLVPVYGVEKYVYKCAESIFAQTYENLEIIFVNDQTLDNSVEVINSCLFRYKNRQHQTRIIAHDTNKGLSGARNTGIDSAHGEYIIHVDGDDYLDIDAISKLVDIAQMDKADIVIFNMRHCYSDKKIDESQIVPASKKDIIKQLLNYRLNVGVCGKLIKTSLYKDNNIQAFQGINFGEDYAITPRLAYYSKKTTYLNEALYNYVHFNPSSYTESYKSKNIDDLKRVIELHREFFKIDPEYTVFIEEAAINVKLKMLIALGINRHIIGSRLKEISSLYMSEEKKYRHNFSLPNRGVLYAARHLPLPIFSLYVRFALKVKSFLKLIL